MKFPILSSSGALALLVFSAAAVSSVRADVQTLQFPDSSKPGKVVIQIGIGDVSVVGDDVSEVMLSSSEDLSESHEPRDDGLRRLDADEDYAVNADGNVITIVCNNVFGGRRHGGADISVKVPRKTNVSVERVGGPGDTSITSLEGDVEVRGSIGDVSLDNVSGGCVVEAVNGDVSATFGALSADRPLSFSTVNGDVDVHVPESAAATVRFRTLRGEVLTNFSAAQLKTRRETEEIEDVEVSTNVSADVKAPVKVTVRSEREAAEADAKRARAEAQKAEREAEAAMRQAEATAVEAKRIAKSASKGKGGVPPIPPIPPMPPYAGGKVVTGQLNGGGTAVTITTLMGDITFRKLE